MNLVPGYVRRLGSGFMASGALIALAIAYPVLSHEIESSGNVAATFHIEPSHNPKVGKPSRAWFALTRRGGQLIPLSQCNCKLAVYPVPYQAGQTPPLMRPALTAYSVERYQGIPSALITFAKPGLYELKFSGKPKSGVNFDAFELSYRVTVSR
jgi:hypothetical protein